MRLRMVVAAMALLAAGCGAEAEPWSTGSRVSFVNSCVKETEEAMDGSERMKTAFEEAGVTTHRACRCGLEGLEERYSESDFLILSPTEVGEALEKAVSKCLRDLDIL